MLRGMPISFCAFSKAVVASPRDAFGARLKEMVTTGNWPWWFTESGPLLVSKCEKALRGTAEPLMDETAVGFVEPELVAELVIAERGLEPAVAAPPLAVVAVTTSVAAVVKANGASAER